MTDRLAELGALQWAVENLATAGTNPNRLGLAGYIHAAYTDYQTWAATYPDPAIIPALIRMAKIPGEALPWVQPIDQYDAYKLVNPFTGEGDRCTHEGFTWKVTQADGAGNNVYAPGVFGWTQV